MVRKSNISIKQLFNAVPSANARPQPWLPPIDDLVDDAQLLKLQHIK